jgi:hypothetical protein
MPRLLEQPEQLAGLVGGDARGDAENDARHSLTPMLPLSAGA